MGGVPVPAVPINWVTCVRGCVVNTVSPGPRRGPAHRVSRSWPVALGATFQERVASYTSTDRGLWIRPPHQRRPIHQPTLSSWSTPHLAALSGVTLSPGQRSDLRANPPGRPGSLHRAGLRAPPSKRARGPGASSTAVGRESVPGPSDCAPALASTSCRRRRATARLLPAARAAGHLVRGPRAPRIPSLIGPCLLSPVQGRAFCGRPGVYRTGSGSRLQHSEKTGSQGDPARPEAGCFASFPHPLGGPPDPLARAPSACCSRDRGPT